MHDNLLTPASSASAAPRARLRPHRGTAGLTLVELLVVVGMLGSLAAVAIPTFSKAVLKARRAEAMMALRSIFNHELAYYNNRSEYTDSFEELGFAIEGGVPQGDGSIQAPFYRYSLQTWALDGQANANYRATATGDIDPSDAVLDIIIIENQLTVIE